MTTARVFYKITTSFLSANNDLCNAVYFVWADSEDDAKVQVIRAANRLEFVAIEELEREKKKAGYRK